MTVQMLTGDSAFMVYVTRSESCVDLILGIRSTQYPRTGRYFEVSINFNFLNLISISSVASLQGGSHSSDKPRETLSSAIKALLPLYLILVYDSHTARPAFAEHFFL